MSDKIMPPQRAHVFSAEIQADTVRDLVFGLRAWASEIERGQLSTGVTGGPSWGGVYSYKHDAAVTHESYFACVDAYLEQCRARDRSADADRREAAGPEGQEPDPKGSAHAE